jgi:hypothetical protein
MRGGGGVTETVYRRAIDLMEAELGDELVALDPKAGECFGFNSVATSIWRELKTPKNFQQLRDALLEEYEIGEDQCSLELQGLIDELIAKGLVVKAA